MSGKIFINYRRDDASHLAGRLYDRLAAHFPKKQIFIDVDNLDPGVDFVEAIEQSVGSCDVLIAVIGKRWLTSEAEGSRRLDNPDDFVRLEIATALKRNIRVIPVLVDDASMPRASELPDDLKSLVRRNAVEVSHTRFSADSERLIAALERVFEKTAAEQREREEKERLEVQRRRETELKERLEAERRQKEETDRLETEQREKERLEAEQRERERPEHVPQSQLPSSVPLSTAPTHREADKSSAETPKVSPKPAEPERLKPPPLSPRGTGGKSPSKQVIAFLAIAVVLVVGGLIYLATRASQSPSPKPPPVAAVTPSSPTMATPTVEEKAPQTPAPTVQPTAKQNVPGAVAAESAAISTPSAPGAYQKVTIPVIVKDTTSFFWQIVLAGARKAGKDLDVNVAELGAQSDSDINGQISILETAVSEKPAAIVIAPVRFKQLGKPIDEAAEKVIIVGIDSAADSRAFTSFLATDNVQGGRLAADGLAAAIKAKYGDPEGDVALITSLPGVGSLDQRAKGFKEEIAAKYPGLKLVADKVADGMATTALNIMTDLITVNPNLRGVFASNLIMAQGAGQAIGENKVANSIKLVGFDSDDKLVKFLANGTIAALVVQDPYRMGYEGVKAALVASKGEKVPAYIVLLC